jgi:hypothetical protein
MSSISSARGLLSTSVKLLNQPVVKEGVKNLAGSITFAFGLVEMYDIYCLVRGRKITTEDYSTYSKWIQVSFKTIIVSAKISLILSAGVSRPGVYIIATLVGCVFTTVQLERVFGANTIFAINPWHPRHVASIAAVILALPSVLQSTYKGMGWIRKKISHSQMPIGQGAQSWLSDSKIRLMALFNTITSRPTLHIGNQLSRLILRPV